MTLSPPLVSMMTDDAARRALPPLPRPADHPRREGGRPHRARGPALPRRRAVLRRRAQRHPQRVPRAVLLEHPHRVPQAPRRGQAGDHHLRRDPRLLPAHGHRARGGARPGAGGGRALPQALRPRPQGIWLPECGYMPGQERFLREAGIRFTFLESHGITDAHPRPRYGVIAPILSPGGVVFFGRDMESSRQVWSAESGYPGDYDYREFYKDIGWELPARLPGRRRCPTASARTSASSTTASRARSPWARSSPTCRRGRGARRRSTPATSSKNRSSQIQHAAAGMDAAADRGEPLRRGAVRPLVVRGADVPRLPLPQDALRPGRREADHAPGVPGALSRVRVVQPPMCTWGAKGYAEVWLNPSNDWIYPHLEMAAERMVELARRFRSAGRPGAARPQPGRPRAAAGAGLGLGLHHEDGHHGRVREEAHARPRRALHLPLPRAQGRR